MSKRKPLTEAQWLTGTQTYVLLKYLQQHLLVARAKGGKRKLRLLSVGCCRADWHLITNADCRRTIEVAERAADSKATRIEVRNAAASCDALAIAAQDRMQVLMQRGHNYRSSNPEVKAIMLDQAMAYAASYAASQRGGILGLQIVTNSVAQLQVMQPDAAAELPLSEKTRDVGARHCDLIRDVFGNPFRPVTIDPRWCSSTVLDLARTIYDDRGWERMPILADALMDAGCDSEDLIKHCQGTGPHVRGCFVVDLLLGK